LVDQLRIYRYYWLAARKIWRLFSNSNYGFAREKILAHQLPDFSCQIKLKLVDLEKSFKNVLSQLPVFQKKEILKKRKISLKEKIVELINLLNKQQKFILNTIFANKTKDEKVFIFLAMLQLSKEGEIKVFQDELFGRITIEKYAQ